MILRKLAIMSLFSTIMGLFGCTAQSSKFATVDVEEFAKVIADTAVVRLDVRTPQEYAEGHIDGAINIDVLSDGFAAEASKLPADRTIALYCRSGNRSKTAAKILSSKGYEVVELGSGFNGWVSAGKKVAR